MLKHCWRKIRTIRITSTCYAEFLMSIGDAARAVETYETLLEHHGGRAEHWYYYGNALKVSGRTKDAIKLIAKACHSARASETAIGISQMSGASSSRPKNISKMEAGLADDKPIAGQKGLLHPRARPRP